MFLFERITSECIVAHTQLKKVLKHTFADLAAMLYFIVIEKDIVCTIVVDIVIHKINFLRRHKWFSSYCYSDLREN